MAVTRNSLEVTHAKFPERPCNRRQGRRLEPSGTTQHCRSSPLIAFDFKTAAKLSGLSRAWLYRDARLGKLRVLKAGTRSLILYGDLLAYMQSLPSAQFKPILGAREKQDALDQVATEEATDRSGGGKVDVTPAAGGGGGADAFSTTCSPSKVRKHELR